MLQLARHLERPSNDELVMESANGEQQLIDTSDKSMDVPNKDIKLLAARDLSHIHEFPSETDANANTGKR